MIFCLICRANGNLIHILTCSSAAPVDQVTWNRRNQSVLGVRWVKHKFLPVKFSYPDVRMQSRRTPKPNEPNIISVIMQNTQNRLPPESATGGKVPTRALSL